MEEEGHFKHNLLLFSMSRLFSIFKNVKIWYKQFLVTLNV
jgi:hypothetical protein